MNISILSHIQELFSTKSKRRRNARRGYQALEALEVRMMLTANLVVNSIDVPAEVTQGDPFTVNVMVQNTGNEDAGAFSVNLKLEKNGKAIWTAKGSSAGLAPVSGLEVDEIKEIVFSVSSPIKASGKHKLIVIVDSQNDIKEGKHGKQSKKELDNKKSTTLKINVKKPDFITSFQSVPNGKIALDTPTPILVTVHNKGDIAGKPKSVKLIINQGAKEVYRKTNAVSEEIAAGGKSDSDVKFEYAFKSEGEYTIIAIVDPANKVKEADENNTSTTTVSIKADVPLKDAISNRIYNANSNGVIDDNSTAGQHSITIPLAIEPGWKIAEVSGRLKSGASAPSNLVQIAPGNTGIIISNSGFFFGIVDVFVTFKKQNSDLTVNATDIPTFSVKFQRVGPTQTEGTFGQFVAADLHAHMFSHFGKDGEQGNWKNYLAPEKLQEIFQEIAFDNISHLPTAVAFTEHWGEYYGYHKEELAQLKLAIEQFGTNNNTLFMAGVEHTLGERKHQGAPFDSDGSKGSGSSDLLILNHFAQSLIKKQDNPKQLLNNLDLEKVYKKLQSIHNIDAFNTKLFGTEFSREHINKYQVIKNRYSFAVYDTLLNQDFDVMPLISGDDHSEFKKETFPQYLEEKSPKQHHGGTTIFRLLPGETLSKQALQNAAEARRGFIVYGDSGIVVSAFALTEAEYNSTDSEDSELQLSNIPASAQQMGAHVDFSEIQNLSIFLEDFSPASSTNFSDKWATLRYSDSAGTIYTKSVKINSQGGASLNVSDLPLNEGQQLEWAYWVVADSEFPQDLTAFDLTETANLIVTSAFKASNQSQTESQTENSNETQPAEEQQETETPPVISEPETPAETYASTSAVKLDGKNDYIDLGNDASLQLAHEQTVSFWVKPANGNALQKIISKGDGLNSYSWTIGVNNGHIHFGMSENGKAGSPGKSSSFQSIETIPVDQVSHVVWSFNRGVNRVFINGVEVELKLNTQRNGGAQAIYTGNNSVQIGKEALGNRYLRHFEGEVDEVSIWSTELTESDIQEIYNHGIPGNLLSHSREASLVSWWDMENITETSQVSDRKGDNHGKMIGMV
ncbi:CARDB domain-containing protein [Gimesia fumaroli]|nr:CARDB domain-containing protein [Gimesia fumaroli]